eukprot:jgi/Tetstr1/424903/TSEL_015398.t1
MAVCAVRQTGSLSRMMPSSGLDPSLEAVDAANISAAFSLLGTAALNGEELGASSCETLKADLISKNDLTHITCGTCSETKCNSSLPLNGPKLPLLLFGAVGLAFALVF